MSKKNFLVDTLLKRAEDFSIQKKQSSAQSYAAVAKSIMSMSEDEFFNFCQQNNFIGVEGVGVQLNKSIIDILSFAPEDSSPSVNTITSLDELKSKVTGGIKESLLVAKSVEIRDILYLLHVHKVKSTVSISTDNFLVTLKE